MFNTDLFHADTNTTLKRAYRRIIIFCHPFGHILAIFISQPKENNCLPCTNTPIDNNFFEIAI